MKDGFMKVDLDEALKLAKANNYYYLLVLVINGQIHDAIAFRALFPKFIRIVNDYVQFAKNLGYEVQIKIYYVPTGKEIGLTETTFVLEPDLQEEKPIKNSYM